VKKKKRIVYPDLFSQLANSLNTKTTPDIPLNTKDETDTFLSLINTEPALALDYLNCWLILKEMSPLPEDALKTLTQSVTMLLSSKTKKD
jgi:hypothetical protein